MRKTERAIHRALGQSQTDSLSRPLSRQSSRGVARQFDHLDDKEVIVYLVCWKNKSYGQIQSIFMYHVGQLVFH